MRFGLLAALVILGVALAFAAPPSHAAADKPDAAHKADGKKDAAHKDGEHKDAGKIDLFKGWLDLTIWTIVVFLILFFVLSNYAWPQIRAGLDKRESDIARDRAEADKAKREAEALRHGLQAEMAKAHEEARRIVDKAVADARTSAADELARGKTELASEKDRLHNDLARERDQALQEVWAQGASLASLISAKVIGKSLSEDDHRALLSQALDEFKASARSRVHDIESATA